MERREAMRNMALLLGGTISASTFSVLFESCASPEKKENSGALFSPDQETLITEVADVIIPDTDTPGAKAAGVGPFVAMMIRECYPEDIQNVFIEGLADVDERSESKFKNRFVELNPQQKNQVLREIADKTIQLKKEETEKGRADAEKNNNQTIAESKTEKKTHFFQLIRELTLVGYFTSEIGATKALAYLPVPGKYEGCIDLKPGQKTWAL